MEQVPSKKIKFDNIRKKWDEDNQKWYFSIVDMVGLVTKSNDARNYWKVFKNRLKTKQNKLVTSCNQLKLEASDGKFYLTDVADISTITELLKIISPENIFGFRAWALGLNEVKFEKSLPQPTKKIMNDISFEPKKKSYPQVTYTLANLIKKNPESSNTELSEKEESREKKFKKITKMRTI